MEGVKRHVSYTPRQRSIDSVSLSGVAKSRRLRSYVSLFVLLALLAAFAALVYMNGLVPVVRVLSD
jgi:hypothetical protein